MNIGIDIDNTITNTREMIYKYAQTFSTANKLAIQTDMNEYLIEKSLGWSQQTAHQFLAQYLPLIYRDVSPKNDAIQVIKQLHQDHKIVLITARNQRDSKVKAITQEWLEQHELPYHKLVMNNTENVHHFSKLEACLEYEIDVMIEDHPDVCLELSQTLPVLIFDQPYNQHVQSEGITRVNTWREIKTLIGDIIQKDS
ncbi:MAG: hypothetical protein U9N81_03890 [Bacillota bacterium]|nr:hypothetical protein [Bacillota bacterium]